jgi:hypothetical protein
MFGRRGAPDQPPPPKPTPAVRPAEPPRIAPAVPVAGAKAAPPPAATAPASSAPSPDAMVDLRSEEFYRIKSTIFAALIETIEFSKAVRYAMDHTDAKDTLIIVTADHSHTFTIAGYPSRGNDILGLVRDVPDTDGAPLVASKDANGMPYTTLGYVNGPGYRKGGRPDLTSIDTTDLDFLQEAAVPLGSETHAGEDVAVFARGPQAHLVRGSMEQNWIFHVMRAAFGF